MFIAPKLKTGFHYLTQNRGRNLVFHSDKYDTKSSDSFHVGVGLSFIECPHPPAKQADMGEMLEDLQRQVIEESGIPWSPLSYSSRRTGTCASAQTTGN